MPDSPAFSAEAVGPNTAVVRVGRALDFRNAADFKALCQEYVGRGVTRFVLDFTGTGVLDSTGLGTIFSIYRAVTPSAGQVVFASVSRPVQVVVELTRTYKVFKQYPTVAEAVDALAAS